jgi:hypothetical protein
VYSRLLVIDEGLNKRLGGEIRRRGRRAASVAQLHLRGAKDPTLLRTLFSRDPDCVLVTGDDRMPEDHGDVLAEVKATVATIDPERFAGYSEEEW